MQKPDLVAVEGKIAHAQRKLRNNEATRDNVLKDETKKSQHVETLKRDLADVRKAAEEAKST